MFDSILSNKMKYAVVVAKQGVSSGLQTDFVPADSYE